MTWAISPNCSEVNCWNSTLFFERVLRQSRAPGSASPLRSRLAAYQTAKSFRSCRGTKLSRGLRGAICGCPLTSTPCLAVEEASLGVMRTAFANVGVSNL